MSYAKGFINRVLKKDEDKSFQNKKYYLSKNSLKVFPQ